MRAGSVRIEKIRRGPLTFGAYNALLLENLEITIPLHGNGRIISAALDNAADGGSRDPESPAMLDFNPETFAFLNPGGRSFSSVKIEGLTVSRQTENGTEPLFTAKRGATGGGGFELESCVILSGGASNAVHGAKIRTSGGMPRLEWRGGSLPLAFASQTERKQTKANKEET